MLETVCGRGREVLQLIDWRKFNALPSFSLGSLHLNFIFYSDLFTFYLIFVYVTLLSYYILFYIFYFTFKLFQRISAMKEILLERQYKLLIKFFIRTNCIIVFIAFEDINLNLLFLIIIFYLSVQLYYIRCMYA